MVVTFHWGLACAVQLPKGIDEGVFCSGPEDLARAIIHATSFNKYL